MAARGQGSRLKERMSEHERDGRGLQAEGMDKAGQGEWQKVLYRTCEDKPTATVLLCCFFAVPFHSDGSKAKPPLDSSALSEGGGGAAGPRRCY